MVAKKEKEEPSKKLEAEVWNAISAFEQILEAMPTDRASLDALSHAYEQIGDHAKAKEYFLRLGRVVLDERDGVAAAELIPKLKEYGAEDADARKLAADLEGIAGGVEVKKESRVESKTAPSRAASSDQVRMGFNIADELSMAWNLMEANELTQEEYASVVQDLTEMSASESPSTVSVLHVLESRNFKNLDKILGFISRQCSTPIVSLASFELQPDVVGIVPREFTVRRGAFLFELLGNDGLVVVMNPYDKALRKDVESMAARKCHFFISLPSEFDKAIEKATELISGKK